MVMRYTHIADPAVDAAMRVLEDANTRQPSYTENTHGNDGRAVA
jgi:hypothetical protein